MNATKCVFAFGLFDKDAKLKTDDGFGLVEVVRKGRVGRVCVPMCKTGGSIDVVRSQLHEYVDSVCDAYEKEKP